MKRLAFIAALAATPAMADMAVTIPFAAEIGGVPVTCADSYTAIGTTGSTVQVADFRLYVSNVRMIAADGAEVPVSLTEDGMWQTQGIALLDFEDATGSCGNGTAPMNTALTGTVPEGSYAGLAFDIGVPFALNHGDPTLAPSPLNLTAMFWTWQGGYKFIKVDLATAGQPIGGGEGEAGHENGGWSMHLGSTGCASDARTAAPAAECANPNRMAISLPGFDLAAHQVVLDLAPVLAAANVDQNAPESAAGCMSFPDDADCPPVMSALGLPYMGTAPAASQAFVSLR